MGVRGVLIPIIPWLLLISLFPPSQASSGDVQFRECMEDMLHLISQLKQKVEKCQMSNGTTVEPQPDASAATTTGNPISLSSTVCDSNPCLNGGTCWLGAASRSNKYKCACPDDFSGDNCEEKVTCTEDSCRVDDNCYVANHRTNCVCKRRNSSEPCESGWSYFAQTNFCYKVGDGAKWFPAAEKDCVSVGAHVASIHSLDENDFLRSKRIHKVATPLHLWIGLTEYRNKLENIDGSAVDYTNFAPNEPNDHKEIPEECIDMFNSRMLNSSQGMWFDTICNQNLNYVCKKAAVS